MGGSGYYLFSYWGLSLGPAVGGCAGRTAQGTWQREALTPDMVYDNALELRDAFKLHAAMLIKL